MQVTVRRQRSRVNGTAMSFRESPMIFGPFPLNERTQNENVAIDLGERGFGNWLERGACCPTGLGARRRASFTRDTRGLGDGCNSGRSIDRYGSYAGDPGDPGRSGNVRSVVGEELVRHDRCRDGAPDHREGKEKQEEKLIDQRGRSHGCTRSILAEPAALPGMAREPINRPGHGHHNEHERDLIG